MKTLFLVRHFSQIEDKNGLKVNLSWLTPRSTSFTTPGGHFPVALASGKRVELLLDPSFKSTYMPLVRELMGMFTNSLDMQSLEPTLRQTEKWCGLDSYVVMAFREEDAAKAAYDAGFRTFHERDCGLPWRELRKLEAEAEKAAA